MKIGIIVYSQTGNTLSVAERLVEALSEVGHTVSLEQVTVADNKERSPEKIQLTNAPGLSKYETVILGAPVQGFSLCPVMKAYLSQAEDLKEKNTICFMTQYFPYKWMGGKSAIGQMKKICMEAGNKVSEAGIVNWSNKKRQKQIDDITDKLVRML